MCAVQNNDKFIYYINNQYKNLSNVINDVIGNRSMVEVILSDEELKNEFNGELKLFDTTKPFIDLISCKDISNKNYPVREDFF